MRLSLTHSLNALESLASEQFVKLCLEDLSSSDLFQKEVSFIKDILAANGYPQTFLNSLVHKFNHRKLTSSAKDFQFGPKQKSAFLKLPYKGNQSAVLKRQLYKLFSKLAPWLKLKIVFSDSYKLARLSNLKCSLPVLKQSNVIYKVNCSECDDFYIGKTARRLSTRLMKIRRMKIVLCTNIPF